MCPISFYNEPVQNVKEFQDNTLIPNGWEKAPGYFDYYGLEGIALYKRWNEAFNAEEELWLSYWRHSDKQPTGAISGWTLLYLTSSESATQSLYRQVADEIQNKGQQNGCWEKFNGTRGLGEYGAYYTFNKVNVNGYDEDMEFCPGDGGVILTPRKYNAHVVQGPDAHGAVREAPLYIGSPYDYQVGIVFHQEEDPLLR